ncbi:MAG: hypothetical protein ABJB02_02505 [Dokdonella sp.]
MANTELNYPEGVAADGDWNTFNLYHVEVRNLDKILVDGRDGAPAEY